MNEPESCKQEVPWDEIDYNKPFATRTKWRLTVNDKML